MCEQEFYENDSFIGGQGYFAPDYEKGQGDQDRQIKKISQVGHREMSESAGGAGLCGQTGALLREEIRVADICDACQRVRSFWSNCDYVCKSHTGKGYSDCLARYYTQARSA